MTTVKDVTVNGTPCECVTIQNPGGAGHPNMIFLQCGNGYLMCGYLNLAAAEKFGDAAVMVGGADIDACLKNPIKGATTAAKALGVKEGMTGSEAAAFLNA